MKHAHCTNPLIPMLMSTTPYSSIVISFIQGQLIDNCMLENRAEFFQKHQGFDLSTIKLMN